MNDLMMRSLWVEIGRMDGPGLMRKVVAGFEKSDMGPLLAAMHDEIAWKSARRYDALFRSSGEYKTRPRMIELLTDLFQNYKFHRLEPKEIVAIGDVVWGHFDVVLSFGPKGSGIVSKHVDLEMAIRWRIQKDKIIEHQSFFDTGVTQLHMIARDEDTRCAESIE